MREKENRFAICGAAAVVVDNGTCSERASDDFNGGGGGGTLFTITECRVTTTTTTTTSFFFFFFFTTGSPRRPTVGRSSAPRRDGGEYFIFVSREKQPRVRRFGGTCLPILFFRVLVYPHTAISNGAVIDGRAGVWKRREDENIFSCSVDYYTQYK